MLKPDNRLAKTRDFNLLLKHGHWVNGRFLAVRVLELAKVQAFFPKRENPDKFKNQLRLAVIIGLKVSKSAVKRNRFRRQTSEALRLLIKDGRFKTGYYLLFSAKKDILEKNYAEISEEIKLLLNRGNLLITHNDRCI